MSSDWESLHIFYENQQDRLLIECIEPSLQELKKCNLIQMFFFIRYWDGGPHIRLRVKADNCHTEAVRNFLFRSIESFIVSNPSKTSLVNEFYERMAKNLVALEDQKISYLPIQNNNSLSWVEYVPEIEKYKGKFGLAISEDVFYASSVAVLSLLAGASDARSYRLSLALVMMLTSLVEFELGDTDIIRFMTGYKQYWSQYSLNSERFVAHTAVQEEKLQRWIRSIVIEKRRIKSPILDTWVGELAYAHSRLKNAVAGGHIDDNQIVFHGLRTSISEELLFHYIHLNNNRLGILPAEESELASLALDYLFE